MDKCTQSTVVSTPEVPGTPINKEVSAFICCSEGLDTQDASLM